MHKPIVAYFHKPGWKYMLEEPSYKLKGLQFHRSLLCCFCVGIPKEYLPCSHTDNSFIRYGGTENVGCEVANTSFTASDRLGIDVPVLVPCIMRKQMKEAFFF
jgi:hypothetical protein